MDKDAVLLKYLRNMSSLLRDLVDKALREGITIMTGENCRSCLLAMNEQKLVHTSLRALASRNCSDIGLGKIIIVSPQFLLRNIREGNLGVVEKGFAHEIGHLLTWQKQPWCGQFLVPSYCAYFEILADKTSLDIFKELRPKGKLKFLYKGKSKKLSKIFRDYNIPKRFINEGKVCFSLIEHDLDRCPKEKEIRELAKIIKKSKL